MPDRDKELKDVIQAIYEEHEGVMVIVAFATSY
ncbi:hypothetical protein J2T13_001296 [Paenibacillus sp. DS2015]